MAGLTTEEAAKKANVSISVFRTRAKKLKLKASGFAETGKRGRPSRLWALGDIGKVASA